MVPLTCQLLVMMHVVIDVGITLGHLGMPWNFQSVSAPETWFLLCTSIRQAPIFLAIRFVKRGESDKLRNWLKLFYIIGILCHIFAVVQVLVLDELGKLNSAFYSCTIYAILFSYTMPRVIWRFLVTEDSEKDGNSRNETTDLFNLLIVFWPSAQSHWKWYASAIGLEFLNSFLLVQEASIVHNTLSSITTSTSSSWELLNDALPLLAVFLFQSSCRYASLYFMRHAKLLTAQDIRNKLFRSILRQSMDFFDENEEGTLSSRMTETKSISGDLPDKLRGAVRNVFQLCGAVYSLSGLCWKLIFLTLIAVPISVLTSGYQGTYSKKMGKQTSEADAKASKTSTESFALARNVHSFGARCSEKKRYGATIKNWFNISSEYAYNDVLYDYFWILSWRIEDVCMHVYGLYLIQNGRLALAAFHVYLRYRYNLTNALLELTKFYPALQKTVGESKAIIDIMNREPYLNYQNGYEKREVVGNVVFEDVHFSYPTRKGLEVLKGINLSLEAGKTLALVGPSGNGKSTIVSLLQQFYAPTSGRILLDGIPIEQFDHKHFHRNVSIVGQEPTLFSGTIRENILYGLESEEGTLEERMLEAAKIANVHDFVSDFELGYDTPCGEKGVKMSGGQKQRIAIARAICRKPKVLILDEATSALDAESESLVQEAIDRCSEGMTVLVIAHRLSTIRKAHQIAVIEKGRVTEMGSHEELMENTNGYYHKLVKKQLNNY